MTDKMPKTFFLLAYIGFKDIKCHICHISINQLIKLCHIFKNFKVASFYCHGYIVDGTVLLRFRRFFSEKQAKKNFKKK